jgi:phosphohistidine phosphatase
MIQLTLVRHAKSDWGDPGLDDHDRPLNSRGLRDATEAARTTLRAGVRPELVLTSTALRARTTAEYFATAFGAELREVPALYGAAPEVLLDTAREAGVDELALVAHDPGLSELVSELSGKPVRMTTAAVAVFTWEDADWYDVGTVPPDGFTLTTPG